MIDDFESKGSRSSGELWSEICSNLPEPQEEVKEDQDEKAQFTDSFQPSAQNGTQGNGICSMDTFSPWEPMADSDIYIASLENRLKRIKGQASEVTSREMLRSLSQAKKECWDRFLHDPQTSELFQNGGDMDEGALEHFKRWLIPEKVAISAEELEYLLRPSQTQEQAGGDHSHSEAEEEQEDNGQTDEAASPEK
ncbi:coiled-coil domain-containing protein 32 [Sardina pilchardus]|uniref:coiled-coil domain-containing protein 32 n=1 Tax=Sardina pilchardus TaxID=27697 RepID=UPI002E0FC5FE